MFYSFWIGKRVFAFLLWNYFLRYSYNFLVCLFWPAAFDFTTHWSFGPSVRENRRMNTVLRLHFYLFLSLCSQRRRSWRGILVSCCPCVRASVGPSVHQEPCMLGFWNFIYGFLMQKSWHTIFSRPNYLPFWSYAPLKKSEWNLMHAIFYEPRMIGFWNLMYGFLMKNIADPYFFLVRVISLSGVMPLWKHQNEILSARYLEQYLS